MLDTFHIFLHLELLYSFHFQQLFDLTPDGIVGKATWYQINRAYVAVQRLAELQSEGQQNYFLREYPELLSLGDTGPYVQELQYMLSVISSFIPNIPPLTQSGTYDTATRDAVVAFQRYAGLGQTGAVGAQTWDAIYDQFAGAEQTVFDRDVLFSQGQSRMQQYPGEVLQPGTTDGGGAT